VSVRPLPPRIVFATTNRRKLAEVAAMLAPRGVEVVAVDAVLPGWSIEENGVTFEENARAKALDVARRARVVALGDDSGLEVTALGGAPGVCSARYAGEGATDGANVATLLAALRDVPAAARQAAFRCALALAWPDGELLEVEGRCEGMIASAPIGAGGFGYDPVFVDAGTGRTFAELADGEKNARSHRGRALAALCARVDRPSP
jgi:XTP/dITP diphosphohydrolase